MNAPDYFAPSRLAIRGTALATLVLWTLSWLAPAYARRPLRYVGALARARPLLLVACAASMVAHMAAVYAATGFPAELISRAVCEIWSVPPDQINAYAVVVGLPCAALVGFALQLVGELAIGGRLGAIVAAPAPSLLLLVFVLNYAGQLMLGNLSNAGLAYYTTVCCLFGHACWLRLRAPDSSPPPQQGPAAPAQESKRRRRSSPADESAAAAVAAAVLSPSMHSLSTTPPVPVAPVAPAERLDRMEHMGQPLMLPMCDPAAAAAAAAAAATKCRIGFISM
eukprot:m51a1_g11361 hypothetical protein (281) ;mRNA; r:27312-30601